MWSRLSPQGLHLLERAVVLQDFVRRKHKHIPIEVETRTLDEVRQVLQFLETDKHSLVKRLMLDNMTKLDPSAPGDLVYSMLSVLLNVVKLLLGIPSSRDASIVQCAGLLLLTIATILDDLKYQLLTCPCIYCPSCNVSCLLRYAPELPIVKLPHHRIKLQVHSTGGVDVSMLREAVKLVDGKVDTEASGNVTVDTVRSIAESGVTYISCGALTHSFQALDISLKIAIL